MNLLERTKKHLIYRHFTTIKTFGNFHERKNHLSISFCEMNQGVVHALHRYFQDREDIEILQGDIFKLACDALVSPANSFGDMSGGLDKAIDDFYDRKAQQHVRHTINEQFLGELPVGNAIILHMDTKRFPFLIVAPTMRVPGNVQHTINAYLAMRAVLVAIIQHNKQVTHPIYSVAIPGFCSGVGGMLPEESAKQMRTAYEMILGEKWRTVIHPALAPYAMQEG